MLVAFAIGLEGIEGGIGGGGGGGMHEFGVGFVPILEDVAPGMARTAFGAGTGSLTMQLSVMASFFNLDFSNLSAMSFCICLNLELSCSPIGSFNNYKSKDSILRHQTDDT